MNPDLSMPSMDAMLTNTYGIRQWLNFYRNVWTRNLAACVIDVQADAALLAVDPNALTGEAVKNAVGQMMLTDKGEVEYKRADVRIEDRKQSVQNAVDILSAIDAMESLDDDALAKAWSPEALMPKPKAADVAVDSKLVSFTVQPDRTLVTADNVTHAAGETVNLDPEEQSTKDYITDGTVAPTTAGI